MAAKVASEIVTSLPARKFKTPFKVSLCKNVSLVDIPKSKVTACSFPHFHWLVKVLHHTENS